MDYVAQTYNTLYYTTLTVHRVLSYLNFNLYLTCKYWVSSLWPFNKEYIRVSVCTDEEAGVKLTSKTWVHWDRTWLRCPTSIRQKHLLRLMALMFHTSYSATLSGPWFTGLFSVTCRPCWKTPHSSRTSKSPPPFPLNHFRLIIAASKLMYKSRLFQLY